MRECVMRICLVLFIALSLSCSEVTIENGGYNLWVAFSQNVPSDTGMEIISKMEASLQEASQVLHNAIGLQFSKVTFEIPEYWDTSQFNRTVEDYFNIDSVKADILIDNTEDTVFGKFPFAQQYGSCGVQGHQIIVPTVFFSESNTFPKGTSLAREWLKYRYGVFDENGYLEDPLYPLYYRIPGSETNDVFITGCTNTEITYNITNLDGEECPSDKMLIDKLIAQECKLHLNEEDLENVTSSLMYFQESITNMKHICGKDSYNHNSRSPNKQNVLCSGKSIWDIVSQSNDFKKKLNEEHTEVEFVLTKRAERRVVVAWEKTKNLENKGNVVLNAIRKLLIDLPDGSKFNAFPFPLTENIQEDYSLKDLNTPEQRKASSIDIKGTFSKTEDGNYKTAIEKAISILKAADEDSEDPPGNIIVITGTPNDLVVVLLKNLKICIKKFKERNFFGEVNNLASKPPCLEVFRIPQSYEPERVYEKLIETMESVCPSKVQDKLTEMLRVDSLKENANLKFEVDDFTETITFSIFGDMEGDSFELKFNEETETKKVNIENYANVLRMSYSPAQDGSIDFTYTNSVPENTLIEVKKTSKPGQYFSGTVLVHNTTDEEENQMPVIIYAIIRFGSYPVQNAKVFAEIERPNEEKVLLTLNDNGKGDPDITQNDGIYSRYFTKFSEAGKYTVRVSVGDNGSAVRIGADKTSGYKSCCGSIVTNDESQKLIQFTNPLMFETTFYAKSGPPADGYKPSRVTDLRIDKINDDGIVLKWTAPGEEADDGTASRYEIKVFCGEENRTECNVYEVIQVLSKPLPMNYGKEQQLKIKIMDKTQIISISIVAFNKKNKTSDISNIIEIFKPTAIMPDITTKEPVIKAAQASKIGIIVGWVIAGVCIIICILGIVVYLRKRQQHEKPELNSREENKDDDHRIKTMFEATDNPIKIATVKRIESFPVLLYTHDQIKDYKSKENDQSLYKSVVPPKQWKSLDVIANLQNESNNDTKSLGSSSTLTLQESNNKKGTVNIGDL